MFNYIQLYSIVFIYMSIIFIALYNLYSCASNYVMFNYIQLHSFISQIFVALYNLYSFVICSILQRACSIISNNIQLYSFICQLY